jgi:bifunctional DNA-binding transcriptional regulator/antitoxin component of YhaV-PrlF toxin-antitoxin module
MKMTQMGGKPVGVVTAMALAATFASSARAESSRFYTLEGFGEFLDGNPESTAITEDGTIILPPTVRERFEDAAVTFSAAAARGEEVLVARVDDGQVLAIDRAGKTRDIYRAEEPLVTALVSTAAGIFVATSSPAKLFRVDDGGNAELFHTPDAGYIWSATAGPNGTLLLATGEPGSVVQVDSRGNGTVLFEPEQEHLRTVVYDRELGIFVGGGEKGVLYRARDRKTFRALYDSGHPEITAILLRGNYAYVAGVTGAEGLANGPDGDEKGKAKAVDVSSQMAQVAMDGSSEVLAGSSDEAIFAMAVNDRGQIVVATGATGRDDPRGRLYTVEPSERQIAMVYQSPSQRITHLIRLPRGALAAVAASGGRVTHVTGGVARKGEYFSKPFDAGINSRYGVLELSAQLPQGTGVTAALRTGQTAVPDDTWSEWSTEVKSGARPAAPNGRYFQLRLTLGGNGKRSPAIHRARLAYLRQNLPPFVREVVALRKGLALFPLPVDTQKTKTISLNHNPSPKSGEGEEKPGNGTNKKRAKQVEEPGALTVKWLAEDPNGDDLEYDLSFRPLGIGEWSVMERELEAPFYTIHSTRLPDGHYQFRVRASDKPSNPDGHELADTRESRAVLVDNTPPRVDPLKVAVNGNRVTARTVVADAVGPIVVAEYSLDGQPPRPVVPDDGVLDGAGESFTVRIGALAPGRHLLTIHVVDEADNHGANEAVFVVR